VPQLIYASKGDIIYINFFETSNAILKTRDGEVKIAQKSKFPEKGESVIRLNTPSGWRGILRVRVPIWAEYFKSKMNGNLVTGESKVKGYLDIAVVNSKDNQLGIQFDVPLTLDNLADNEYAIRRGPEVLAIDIRDNIDTWLGQDDLISLPQDIKIESTDSFKKYQWPGPRDKENDRRRYLIKVEDKRTSEQRGVIWTPYADAGNDGAAFRTIFPLDTGEED
jgi:DUF1680 family protein